MANAPQKKKKHVFFFKIKKIHNFSDVCNLPQKET